MEAVGATRWIWGQHRGNMFDHVEFCFHCIRCMAFRKSLNIYVPQFYPL